MKVTIKSIKLMSDIERAKLAMLLVDDNIVPFQSGNVCVTDSAVDAYDAIDDLARNILLNEEEDINQFQTKLAQLEEKMRHDYYNSVI